MRQIFSHVLNVGPGSSAQHFMQLQIAENRTFSDVINIKNDVQEFDLPAFLSDPNTQILSANSGWDFTDSIKGTPSELVVRYKQYVIFFNMNRRMVYQVDALSTSWEDSRAFGETVKPFIQEREKDAKTWVNFWTIRHETASSYGRKMLLPDWGLIKENYSQTLRNELDGLMSYLRSSDGEVGGKLIIQYGSPGTGKTFLTRALIKECTKWCKPHYIIDPDNFFYNSTYMVDLLTRMSSEGEGDENGVPTLTSSDDELNYSQKWNLLILEDSGEFIVQDAKERGGQALSRLLNLTDGLLGQGMKLIVLISTNEMFDSLNQAVTREGRCLSILNFGTLTTQESEAWLRNHGSDYVCTGPMKISELYGIISENKLHPQLKGKQRVGF